MSRAVQLRSLQTLVPDIPLPQEEVRDVFASQPGLGRLARRIVTASFDGSGIDTRHTVLEELDRSTPPAGDGLFLDRESGRLLSPGTGARNEVYIRKAERLFVEAARRCLESDPDLGAEDVTHVITVSCTGFHAPGPDFAIVRELGMSDAVERYHLGFMGCYAALPALRAARQFCLADPDAVVLVASVELCTLHLRTSEDPDTIVATSLFSDGAAAGLVTARTFDEQAPALALDRFHTAICPDSEQDMGWSIGDSGFEMVLSTAVPQVIGRSIHTALRPLWADDPALAGAFEEDRIGGDVAHWAIHPGGRSILDRVQERLALSEAQLRPAREILREYGNMSSATVLFVLRSILEGGEARAGDRVAAMAFGPGLTAESALLTVLADADAA